MPSPVPSQSSDHYHVTYVETVTDCELPRVIQVVAEAVLQTPLITPHPTP